MSAPDHRLRGVAAFARFVDALAPLGLVLRGAWTWPDRFEGVVGTARKALFRVAFKGTDRSSSLNVLPLDPSSTRLVGHWPNVPLTESGPGPDFADVPTDAFLAAALEEVETFFRAALVAGGTLSRREFPTDGALAAWLARADASEAAVGPLAEAARLRKSFSRGESLALLAVALTDARSSDPSRLAFARDAAWISKGRLARHLLNLRAESHLGFLLPPNSERLRNGAETSSPRP